MICWSRPLAIVAATALFGCGCCVEEERVAYVRSAPQPTAEEVVEVAPGPGYVHIRGHWGWDGSKYVWVKGRYARRPTARAAWVEGHWQSSAQGWYWEEGHWVEAHPKAPHRLPPMYAPLPATPQVEVAPEAPGQLAPAPLDDDSPKYLVPPTPPSGGAPRPVPPRQAMPPAPGYAPPPANAVPPPGAVVPEPQRYAAPPPSTMY